jgi:hypothetical protein
MKTTATLLLAAAMLSAGPASGIEGFAGSEAVMRHSAHMQERPTPDECSKRYRSFVERNTRRVSERRERLAQCLAARAASETVVAGEEPKPVPAPRD